MNAHAKLFPQIPAIVNLLPNPIDQMKLLTALLPVRLGPTISQTIKIADAMWVFNDKFEPLCKFNEIKARQKG
jgi:hypothetical protein